MNATTQVTPAEVAEAVPFERTQVAKAVEITVNHDKLEAIQSGRIQELMKHENELLDRIAALADIRNEVERDRQQSILNADLRNVRTERVKHQEDVGILATELFALYDELGMQTSKAREDTPADIALHEAAKGRLLQAMQAVAEANARVTTAEAEVEKAKNSWFFKGRKTEQANAVLEMGRAAVTRAEEAVTVAQAGIKETEAQVEINKRDRVRKASLGENFALIRLFTNDAISALKKDYDATVVRVEMTEKALKSALEKKRVTARQLDETRDAITIKDRDLVREQAALEEIVDVGSPDYADQEAIVAGIRNEQAQLKGKELELNTTHMAMTQAAAANESSLLGLRVQSETTNVYIIKLTNAEKTAEILGRNIDQMVKNTQQEVASDALDRVTDKMTMTAVKLGIKAEVASAKTRNDAIERHHDLMASLTVTRETGDKAVATEAARYLELDAVIRQGYKERGVDLNMSHLEAAMRAVTGQPVQDAGGEVAY